MRKFTGYGLIVVMLLAVILLEWKTAAAGPGQLPPTHTGIKEDGETDNAGLEQVSVIDVSTVAWQTTVPAIIPHLITCQSLGSETEPNNAGLQANPINANNIAIKAHIYPNADEDYFSFSANAGDRVYAATQTSFWPMPARTVRWRFLSAGGVLESDEDDGSLGSLSSSIAGTAIPAAGTYYVHVRHFSVTNQLRPYYLHFRLQSGSPASELEPNNDTPTATPLPPAGWIAGSINPALDVDFFSLSLNAGDTVFLSLDLDPERDAVTWNGRLGLGIFGGYILVINDTSVTSPNSEAFFFTVKDSGEYYVMVDPPTIGIGDPTFTYHLSASVHPAEIPAGSCSTYTSNTITPIPDAGLATSTITVPGHPRIADVDVSINLTHASMFDLDASLQAPVGNQVGLFSDIGSSAIPTMNMTLDDEAGLPAGNFTVFNGVRVQPELAYRLSWFDGQDAGGTWTLTLYDDLAPNTGTLNSWSVTICEPPPAPSCPAGAVPTVLYSSDFETGDGGFTHSGALDEWERGLPGFAPITSCSSGGSCWKTDLDNTYNASSSQDLRSPAMALTDPMLVGPLTLSWAMQYQMETASFDHAYVEVQPAGGGIGTRLWEWLDATMTNSIGPVPVTIIPESAGWGVHTRDISGLLGGTIELLYHVDGDTSVHLAGLAVDDVSVTACRWSSVKVYLPVVVK